jgi:hypothetical protein
MLLHESKRADVVSEDVVVSIIDGDYYMTDSLLPMILNGGSFPTI